MLAVYERALFKPDGTPVTIAYWNQESNGEKEHYWDNRTK